MKRTTIRDIARAAEVGVSTVSRVINNQHDVGEDTRARVLAIMKSCGYTPNGNAKNLKIKSTDYIAVIICGMQNMFLNSIIERLQNHIESAGYHFIIHYLDERADELEAARIIVAEKKVCAVVFLGGDAFGRDEQLIEIGVPCVFSTSYGGSNAKNVSSVCVNDRLSAETAIDFLVENGHRRIAVLGGTDGTGSIGLRARGARDAMARHGVEPNVIVAEFSLESAYLATRRELQKNQDFTAIFAMSDTMAIGAMRAINEMGLQIPKDISVIGFDGIEISRFTNPPLATLRQPIESIAAESVRLVKQGLAGQPNEEVILDAQLVPGQTVARLQ